MDEYGEKLSEDDKSAINDAIKDLKEKLEAEEGDVEEINTAATALAQASMKLGEAMYQAGAGQSDEDAGAAAAAADAAKEDASDDDVVDADFEEVDGDKKD